MPRFMLTDEHWSKLRPILLDARVYDKPKLRLTVEGILFRLRTGCPWRDLHHEFGNWNSIYKCFNNWSSKGKLELIFKVLRKDPDLEWSMVDGSGIKAHQHSCGAPKKAEDDNGIGKSTAGNSTKIHLATDSYGLPIDFMITGGEVHDVKVAPEFIASLPWSEVLMADRGYDSKRLRKQIWKRNTIPIIPRKKNSRRGNDDIDWGLYKHRHLVENAFARLKHFRSIATRYDKLKRNYEGMLYLACSFIWLPL